MDNRPIYKTAKELGIKQWEHDGLVALVGPLSRDELHLNMQHWHCGATHCIGGWIATLAKKTEDEGTWHNQGLHKLYYPGDFDHPGWKSRGPQAAKAIVNFLTLGDPCWDDVMSARE